MGEVIPNEFTLVADHPYHRGYLGGIRNDWRANMFLLGLSIGTLLTSLVQYIRGDIATIDFFIFAVTGLISIIALRRFFRLHQKTEVAKDDINTY